MATGKVHLAVKLCTSLPGTISLTDPYPSQPLQLIANIRQTSSACPSRPITLLTNYTFLDTTPYEDSFTIGRMKSPTSVTDPKLIIYMHSRGKHITRIRVSGPPDLRKRDNLKFITVPAIGHGEATVCWSLSPTNLFRFGSASLDEKLAHFKPGEEFKIELNGAWISWWTWGAPDDELKNKKFSRWQLPQGYDLPSEEGDFASKLTDPVDLHDVNHLSSRSAVKGEEKPDVKSMSANGWVFSEPEKDLVVDDAGDAGCARFSFVK